MSTFRKMALALGDFRDPPSERIARTYVDAYGNPVDVPVGDAEGRGATAERIRAFWRNNVDLTARDAQIASNFRFASSNPFAPRPIAPTTPAYVNLAPNAHIVVPASSINAGAGTVEISATPVAVTADVGAVAPPESARMTILNRPETTESNRDITSVVVSVPSNLMPSNVVPASAVGVPMVTTSGQTVIAEQMTDADRRLSIQLTPTPEVSRESSKSGIGAIAILAALAAFLN